MATEAGYEDYRFFGTPIDDEEVTRANQYRKAVKDPATTRNLPAWKQVSTARAPPAATAPFHSPLSLNSFVRCPILRPLALSTPHPPHPIDKMRQMHGFLTHTLIIFFL